ncbi:hypothetical protein [Kitasatospora sp. MAA4]|uniref:hypothetical protein n=1 Tax=Kitasatospora sp. MAA4 TaxID=3035093 RepID=UPI002476AD15|nr:hypothetical protein [Kitasatospora sp. MAA4]
MAAFVLSVAVLSAVGAGPATTGHSALADGLAPVATVAAAVSPLGSDQGWG